MKVLHLSDFHYKSTPKDIASQNLLVEKLINQFTESDNIDFLLFTGDIVHSGTESQDFNDAYETLFKQIGEKLKIKKSNTIICPGNHDIDREKISKPIKDYIRSFKNSDQISKLVDENKIDEFELSCKPSDNFNDFARNFYSKSVSLFNDVIDKLSCIHIRIIDGQKIGFVSINTAWCSTGNDDRGNLFYPKSEIEKCLAKLSAEKVKWKILILHHPLTDFREFNKVELEDIIYAEFDMMFSGHLHKRDDFIRLTQNEGIFGSYAHAAFTKKEDGKIGYSIFDIDLNTNEILIQKFIYDFDERVFLPLKEMRATIPCNEVKADQIKVFKTLKKRLEEAIEKSSELNVANKDTVSKPEFNDLFVEPVLRKQPQVEAASLSTSNKVSYQSLFENKNYFIYGKDKTGKTTLLYKLKIDLLNKYSQLGVIPFYIDLADFKAKQNKFDLQKSISKYLEHTYNQTEDLLSTYKFKILIDNFDPSKEDVRSKLALFFTKFTNCYYVIISDQTLAQSYEKIDYGFDGYDKLFIHDISRSEIRQLTNKWPNLPSSKRDEFVERIVDVLHQHSMPFNFWTLSIFLWIYSGKNTLNFNNNSELLELYIDDILDRNRLASDPQNRFSYQNYKLLLSELANNLLLNHRDTNYSIKYAELTSLIEDFKSQNIKRNGKTSEIISHLLERGILKKNEDDFITFRLNGVFEYFIAYNFSENETFFNQILNDDSFYLSFKNEFEIFSGFQRNEAKNREFLENIYLKTKSAFKDLNNRMEGDLDLRLHSSLQKSNLIDLSEPISKAISNGDMAPLSDNEKDDFLDEVNSGIIRDIDVKPKKVYDTSIKNSDILERYLIINGRVFKNIDNIKDTAFVEEVFDFIIDSSCNLGFLLLEELENDINLKETAEIDYSNTKSVIFQLFNNFLPSVVQTFIQDAMGHINLELIITKKIQNLKPKFQQNQFKLFILQCLLLDIDLKKHKTIIEEMIKSSRLGIIKSSVLVKLCYLLIFKAYDDDELIAFLKEKIREINQSINPNYSKRDFETKFESTKKLLLLKRNANK